MNIKEKHLRYLQVLFQYDYEEDDDLDDEELDDEE